MAQTIAIERIDHIGIRVRNLDRALAFYAVLGFALEHARLATAAKTILTAEARLNAGIEQHIEKVHKRRLRLKEKRAGIRDIITSIMATANLRKVDLPTTTVSIVKRGRSVVILDESLIPEELCRIKKEPDKVAIKDALFAGEYVPGATLNNGSETLRIL